MQYKKEEIKDKIITAATAEFEKNGFNGSLIKNIAEQSGVPVGNIYRYFTSKNELFEAVAGNMYQITPSLIQNIYEKEVQVNYKVRDIAKDIASVIMEIYSNHSHELIILIYKSEGTKYSNFMNELYAIVTEIIEKELFNSAGKSDKLLAEIISKGFLNGLFEILRAENVNRIKELIERHVRFYFYKIEERI